jgi:5-methylcytosine-specific restriction endonuclease McrA
VSRRNTKYLPKSTRRFIRAVARWGDACVYCGDPASTTDHYVPRSLGGSHDTENLRPACVLCNVMKGDMAPDAWEAWASTPAWHVERERLLESGRLPSISRPGRRRRRARQVQQLLAETFEDRAGLPRSQPPWKL